MVGCLLQIDRSQRRNSSAGGGGLALRILDEGEISGGWGVFDEYGCLFHARSEEQEVEGGKVDRGAECFLWGG